ncbi:MAG: Asp-tRNA(Asn)/Glu-tRNA(Gln) amidotransferase subunit GatB [Patescibacteria group bacterium]
MSDYKLTVGLEIHAELNTRTKMFCNSKNDPDETRPNVNVCPVCMGHPGTLPVINKEAVRSVLRLGVAVGGRLADYTEFDRKNYFYPDIPKGYQISQYKHPLVSGGEIIGVPITRIHLEEDTAKSTHDSQLTADSSLLNFNRAGVPLLELVTEPEIHDAETAAKFAKEFQLLLLYLGISHANMEKGEMRAEANISVSRSDLENSEKVGPLGTKVEVKNLNSFKSVEKAIQYEFERQTGLLEKGEKIIQETRGWDEEKEETFPQRAKEESHDYRYFPDPDLPKLFLSEIPEFGEENLRKTLPELPDEKRIKYRKLGLKNEDIETFVNNQAKGRYFESVVKLLDKKLATMAANYILTDVKRDIVASNVAGTIAMLNDSLISSRAAKDLLAVLPETETDVKKFAEEKNLIQVSDKEILRKFVEEVIKENPSAPAQFIVGQAMKKSEGRANPVILQKLVLEMLNH